MAKTLQKKIKFSKGQVSPELLERTDLTFYDSSAQEMTNVVSTIYGGVRTRRGTRYIDRMTDINERTPSSITSNIFGSTTHFTDQTTVTSNTLGANKNFATIDYGSNLSGTGKIDIKAVKVIPFEYAYSTAGTITQAVESGRYEITAIGGGGGGASSSYLSFEHLLGLAAAGGGSGAYFRGRVTVGAGGSFKCVVGGAGSGSAASQYPGTKTGGNGGNSSVSFVSGGTTTTYVTANGGKGGVAKTTSSAIGEATAGAGGTFTKHSSVAVSESYSGKAGTTATQKKGNPSATKTANGGAGVAPGSARGAAGGATAKRSGSTAGAGVAGYARVKMVQPGYKLIISVSTDGVDWTQLATKSVSTTASDISVDLDYCYRYVKIEVSGNETSNTKLSFQYIRNDISAVLSGSHPIKMHKFIYNNEDRYLLVFLNQRIQVFKNDELIQIVTATGLLEDYIKDAKVAYKDDTIIITHPEMPPKQLQRQSNGTWSWGNFTIKNTPYYSFTGETEATKTVSITPSATEGSIKITAASSIFDNTWVGQFIDGNGGRVRITEYTSGTVVKGVTIIPFYTTDAIASWTYISGYEAVWSGTRGYPTTCLFAQQRLWFGGSKSLPAHIWASRLDDYNNFKNAGNYDNDAIDVEMLTNNRVMNMVEQRGIHIFTSGDEWTVKEGTYTPNAITITKNTANGSYNIDPQIIGGTVCFIEKNGKSLLSYSYDYDQASFMTDNLSLFSSLISMPVAFDVEINSSKDKADFIYIVLEDGTMLCGCILLDQKIISLSKFVTNGTIKDVCCVLDDIYILVQRNQFYYIEKITNVRTDCSQNLYIEDNEVTGLDGYSGKYVYVYDKDTLYGKFYVEDGTLYIDNPPGDSVEVGIAFDYNLESNPIAINGKTTNIKKRISTATVTCKDTERLEFNGQKKQTKSDVFDFYSCTKYGNDVRFNIKGEFYPVDILSVLLNINYEG